MINIFNKIGLVLSKPNQFWASLENEKGVLSTIKYLSVVLIIGILVIFGVAEWSIQHGNVSAFSMEVLNFGMNFFGTPIAITILIGIVLFSFCFLILKHVLVIFTHLFAKMFGGKEGFDKTYQAYFYGVTPQILFTTIPYLGTLLTVWVSYLQIVGISKLHKITILRAFFVIVLTDIVFFVGIIIASILFFYFFGLPGQS